MNITVGDTVKALVSYKAPHPNDPHPHNPSRFTTKEETYKGEVLEIEENRVKVDTEKKGKVSFKRDEIVDVLERGEGREPIHFEVDGEKRKAVWDPSRKRYLVKNTSQFDVWAENGEVKSLLNVYKGVDPRVKDDVRQKMHRVENSFQDAYKMRQKETV